MRAKRTPFQLYGSIRVYCCRSSILRFHSISSISSTTRAQQSLHSRTSAPDPVGAGPWSCRARAATSLERKGDAGRSHSSHWTQLGVRFSVRKIGILLPHPARAMLTPRKRVPHQVCSLERLLIWTAAMNAGTLHSQRAYPFHKGKWQDPCQAMVGEGAPTSAIFS